MSQRKSEKFGVLVNEHFFTRKQLRKNMIASNFVPRKRLKYLLKSVAAAQQC
jgi:hypothetical protein